eukprot:scpid40803/ scgid28309/ Inhibitor of growth protein 1
MDGEQSEVVEFSSEYKKLDEAAKKRYDEKLNLIAKGAKDPYCISGHQGDHLSDLLPLVEYPDLYNYLITAPSPVTKEELKAYKSLDGHKFLVAGWLGDVSAYEATSDHEKRVVKAKVRHSQSVSSDPLTPWIAAEHNGTIICAHCTCKAGLGEACAHIAALLFALESHTKFVSDNACTSKGCVWLPPSIKSVDYKRIAYMDFTSPSKKSKTSKSSAALPSPTSPPVISASAPTTSELDGFYSKLSEVAMPALLSIVPTYADAYVSKLPSDIPAPLSNLYEESMVSANYTDLLDRCDAVFSTISVTPDECMAMKRATREQAKSDLWFMCRAGRITASKFKAASHSDAHQPSVSLVKAICYPQSMKFTSKATTWGCEHEQIARDAYKVHVIKKHKAFQLCDSGLVVRSDYPYLGASPDGVVSCACCGNGVVEVKCPYSCCDSSFDDATEKSGFCLGRNADGSFFLKKDHAYYYQVQAQMFLCQAAYCDFIVYSHTDLVISRILPDTDFISGAISKVSDFFKLAVLPELVGKFFSKGFEIAAGHAASSEHAGQHEPQTGHCFCNQVKDSETVTCAGVECPVKTFHVVCLRMKGIPKRKWYCPTCRKTRKAEKDAKKAPKNVNPAS